MRDRRIAVARSAGEKWAVIAEREGVSEKTAIRAGRRAENATVKRVVSLPEVLPESYEIVFEIVASQLVALREAVRMLGEVDNDSARVGAMRTVTTVGTGLHTAMVRAGMVRSPGMEWFGGELRDAVGLTFGLAEEFHIPLDVVISRLETLPRRGLPLSEVMPSA